MLLTAKKLVKTTISHDCNAYKGNETVLIPTQATPFTQQVESWLTGMLEAAQ